MSLIKHVVVLLFYATVVTSSAASAASASSPGRDSAEVPPGLGAAVTAPGPVIKHREGRLPGDLRQAVSARLARPVTGANGAEVARRTQRKRLRKMTFPLARKVANDLVREVYLNLDEDWDDYGAGGCKRRTRTKIRCIFWVSEDIYSNEDGSFLDTFVCGGWVDVFVNRRNQTDLWTSKPQCFWDSEL